MLRVAQVTLGWLWAGALLWVGLWLWGRSIDLPGLALEQGVRVARLTSIWAVASSQFIFLTLVADVLCPRTPMLVSGFLKIFTGVLAWLALLGVLGLWLL